MYSGLEKGYINPCLNEDLRCLSLDQNDASSFAFIEYNQANTHPVCRIEITSQAETLFSRILSAEELDNLEQILIAEPGLHLMLLKIIIFSYLGRIRIKYTQIKGLVLITKISVDPK
jgi:hypothetical protein